MKQLHVNDSLYGDIAKIKIGENSQPPNLLAQGQAVYLDDSAHRDVSLAVERATSTVDANTSNTLSSTVYLEKGSALRDNSLRAICSEPPKVQSQPLPYQDGSSLQRDRSKANFETQCQIFDGYPVNVPYPEMLTKEFKVQFKDPTPMNSGDIARKDDDSKGITNDKPDELAEVAREKQNQNNFQNGTFVKNTMEDYIRKKNSEPKSAEKIISEYSGRFENWTPHASNAANCPNIDLTKISPKEMCYKIEGDHKPAGENLVYKRPEDLLARVEGMPEGESDAKVTDEEVLKRIQAEQPENLRDYVLDEEGNVDLTKVPPKFLASNEVDPLPQEYFDYKYARELSNIDMTKRTHDSSAIKRGMAINPSDTYYV